MRALRDFNLPKIITEDVTIIMGLIGDLFPALNVPRKRDMEFEDYVKKAVVVSQWEIVWSTDFLILAIQKSTKIPHVIATVQHRKCCQYQSIYDDLPCRSWACKLKTTLS